MTDRTVTVRLRLDSTQWAAGQSTAVRANDRLAASSRAAATRAERDAQRTAQAVAGTFSGMARTGEAALGRLDAAAARSSQALARSNAAAAASVRQVSLAGSAGARELSLANRLAMAQAAQSSRVAAGAVAGTTSAYARAATAAQVMTARVQAGGARTEQTLRRGRTAALGLVAVFGAAVYESSKFESAMSRVKAATQAPANELNKLRQAAIQAGSSTRYSATQSADAITELAKAGVSTADILGGALRGTLSLAAAGDMSVADSAVVASKAMNSFGESGKDMAHIADVIAAAAGKSATDVHQMSLAFAQSSLLAHQTGLSLEQTAGILALFAQNGLAGSDAGTSLKTMLMRLTPQSSEAAGLMAKLGFSAYDAAGNFVGLEETARRMQQAFGRLTPEARNAAMSVIFGSDAIRAATIVTQAGAAGIDQWTKAANDSGYAARYAATQADNLQGDLRRLKSALETALIQSGTAANGVLRDMAKLLTAVVRWYNSLPPGVQQSVTALTGVAGALGLVATGLLLVLPRLAATRAAMTSLGISTTAARTSLGMLGRAGVVAGVLTAITYATDKLTEAMKKPAPDVAQLTNQLVDLANSGKKSGDSVKDLDDFGNAVGRIAHPSNLNRLDDVASSIGHFGGHSNVASLTEAKDKVKALDSALSSLVQSGAADTAAKVFKIYAAEVNKSGTSTEKLKSLLPQYTDALAGADTQTKLAAGSQKKLADSSELTTDAMKDTRTEAEKLTDVLDSLNGVSIDAASSEIDLRQSLVDMKQIVKDNGHTLDITREKGQKVKQGFLDMAQAAQRHAENVAKLKNSQDAGNKALAADIALIKSQMLQMGFQRKVVDQLLASYLRVPGSVTTKVSADTGQALRDLQTVQDKIRSTKGKSITVNALTKEAQKDLTDLGYKVTHLKDGKIRVTAPTSGAEQAIARLQAKVNALEGTYRITLITENRTINTGKGGRGPNAQADGSVHVRHFAGGGTEQHVAQIARAGEWRVWAEDETGGEAYIPLALSKRRRSRAIAEETVRRLGGRGIAWYANGSVPTYTPSSAPMLGSPSDALSQYGTLTSQLKSAWQTLAKAMDTARDKAHSLREAEANLERVRSHKHTEKELQAAEDRLRNAREANAKAAKTVAGDRRTVNSLDQQLGLRSGSRAPGAFDLASYQKLLGKSLAETSAWRTSLDKIGKRGGSEVRAILEGMGQDGYALTRALAKASDKQFADIVKKLLATSGIAKASLADFQHQIDATTKANDQFASDLQKLAAAGYGDLAQALAAQGDASAQALAHQAAGNSKAAAAANKSVQAAGQALTGQDLADSLTVLATLRSGPGKGFADLVAAGLDVATVKALVPRMMKQITALPAQYRTTFLQQWAGQAGVTAMARGGLLTRPTAVLAAEAGSPEWWIPQNGSARSAALLSAAAAGMGYQLVPAGRWAGAVQVSGGTTHVDRSQTVHLHGAHQSLGEQRADLLRHMTVLA